MSIKMIATDIDGTFIRTDHQFDHDRFARILRQLSARRIHFVIASGNQLRHLTDMFANFDGIDFLAENGGLVVSNQQTLFSETISPNLLQQTLSLIHQSPMLQGGAIVVSGLHGAYLETPVTDELLASANYFYTDLQLVADLLAVQDDVLKVDLVWPDNLADQRADWLNHRLPTSLTATASGFGGLDIIPSHVNKQVGLAVLERHWQISPDQVMAFGDNDNDIAMLRHVGHGYAMLNAAPRIKAAANQVTLKTNDEDGVLDTIETVLALPH